MEVYRRSLVCVGGGGGPTDSESLTAFSFLTLTTCRWPGAEIDWNGTMPFVWADSPVRPTSPALARSRQPSRGFSRSRESCPPERWGTLPCCVSVKPHFENFVKLLYLVNRMSPPEGVYWILANKQRRSKVSYRFAMLRNVSQRFITLRIVWKRFTFDNVVSRFTMCFNVASRFTTW